MIMLSKVRGKVTRKGRTRMFKVAMVRPKG